MYTAPLRDSDELSTQQLANGSNASRLVHISIRKVIFIQKMAQLVGLCRSQLIFSEVLILTTAIMIMTLMN